MSEQPLQVAVVGLGGMGTFHAHLVHGMAGAKVAAVSDPFHPDLGLLAAKLGADVIDDPAAVATDDRVEAMIVASPDDTHAALTLAAIEARKPVLCEKPLATSVADARAVVEADDALPARLVQLGFMREYDEAHVQLVDALADLGDIHYIRSGHLNTPSAPRTLDVIIGQSMVHEIHSVRYITGAEFTSVTTNVAHSADGNIRHVVVLGTLSTGGHVVMEFDAAGYAYDVTVDVTAERGAVSLGRQVRAEVMTDGWRRSNTGADWFGRFAQAYRTEVDAWVAAARAGTATGPTAGDGLAAQLVVEAILASAESGQSVSIAG